jgi:toxin ParE1/3/4
MKVSFSLAAQDDLLNIALYIAQDNPERAATFVDELEAKCNLLGKASGIGAARPELGQGGQNASSWEIPDLLSRMRKSVPY